MRYGSVCSGIEAATVAWAPLGWEADWLAEVEPFPSAVLAHHYPRTPNVGDMTQLAGLIRTGLVSAPDVLVGGTPCQSFSIAGARKGLADARGNLTLEYVRILNAIDEKHPTGAIAVWENVPGVLSSRDNAFGCFLGALAGEDAPLKPAGAKWPNAGCVYGPQRAIAWRILDAQYFGVAQRRRRVFVVASARNEFDPATVLFERESLRRDSAPRRESGPSVAALVASGVGTCGADDNQGQAGHLIPLQRVGHGQYGLGVGTLQAKGGDCAGGSETLLSFGGNNTSGSIEVAPALNACASASGRQDFESETFIVISVGGEVAHTLHGEEFDASEDGTGRGTPIVAKSVSLRGREGGATAELGGECAGTLRASQGGGGKPHVLANRAVRRLTHLECERLQGFPDDYTRIPWRNKRAEDCPDGPRYKSIGNSMAVPVMRWIGERIEQA